MDHYIECGSGRAEFRIMWKRAECVQAKGQERGWVEGGMPRPLVTVIIDRKRGTFYLHYGAII